MYVTKTYPYGNRLHDCVSDNLGCQTGCCAAKFMVGYPGKIEDEYLRYMATKTVEGGWQEKE